ncbi:mycofactocin system transcriptional regulator [Nocardia harenae]|uniref:mycofactocin system transcriptional regulator n=1 Tax=Nocardia harenae TaxID=358707 RepID=UPI000833744B|nr:mycofactocin system transcriptional regulator [Nocardia harenae]
MTEQAKTRSRGRPRGTSRRRLELIALELFTERGFEDTTVEQIAAAAGISERTFFRYFPSKGELLWYQFDDEVAALRGLFATVAADVPMMTAVRRVVVAANAYRAEDVPELRTRMHLLATVPGLAATAGAHYDAWERAVSDFAARRLGGRPDDLVPMAVGRATLATARAAFDAWLGRADDDLTVYLDRALAALAAGFAAPGPVAAELPAGLGGGGDGV